MTNRNVKADLKRAISEANIWKVIVLPDVLSRRVLALDPNLKNLVKRLLLLKSHDLNALTDFVNGLPDDNEQALLAIRDHIIALSERPDLMVELSSFYGLTYQQDEVDIADQTLPKDSANPDQKIKNRQARELIKQRCIRPLKISFNRLTDFYLGICQVPLGLNVNENEQDADNSYQTLSQLIGQEQSANYSDKCEAFDNKFSLRLDYDEEDNSTNLKLKKANRQQAQQRLFDQQEKRLAEVSNHNRWKKHINNFIYDNDNHTATELLFNKKNKKREQRKVADGISLVLAILVALGQGAIAACCFVVLGVMQPLFIPIFIASSITNFLLLKNGIKDLLRRVIDALWYNKPFFEGLTGTRLRAVQASLIFAIAAGLTFGVMALTTTFTAWNVITPLMGLGFLAVPGIGWAVAAGVAIATFVVFMPLLFDAMRDFFKQFDFADIKDYFSPDYNKVDSMITSQKAAFYLSRSWQIILTLSAMTITVLAVIATFGSFTSNIATFLSQFFSLSAHTSHAVSLGIVFVCNLVPELIFNIKNILSFCNNIVDHLRLVKNHTLELLKPSNPLAVRAYALISVTVLSVLAVLIALNAFGNAKTSSQPDCDGINFLQKILSVAKDIAVGIGFFTSFVASLVANELYGFEIVTDIPAIAKLPEEAPQEANELTAIIGGEDYNELEAAYPLVEEDPQGGGYNLDPSQITPAYW